MLAATAASDALCKSTHLFKGAHTPNSKVPATIEWGVGKDRVGRDRVGRGRVGRDKIG